MTLSDWLRTTRTTQVALAARLGVAASTVSRICRGECQPEAQLIAAIARETAGAVLPNDLFPQAVEAGLSAAAEAQAAE